MKTSIAFCRNHHFLVLSLSGLLHWSGICTVRLLNDSSLAVEVSKERCFGVLHCSLICSSFLNFLYSIDCVCTKDKLIVIVFRFWRTSCLWKLGVAKVTFSSHIMEVFPNWTFSWKTHGRMQLNNWTWNTVLKSDFIYFHECYYTKKCYED